MITVEFNRFYPATPTGPGGFRVLDVGCGTGRHTGEAYRRPNVFVVGSDLCFADVSEAARRLSFHHKVGAHGGGIWGLNVADILRLPYRDDAFDAVICSEVLEHIPDHRRAVREVMRVLKPGGDLVVSVPRYGPESVCWALSRAYRRTPGGHVRRYTRRQLIHLLENAGARTTKIHYAHSLHTPYWWLKCLVGIHRTDLRLVSLYHRLLTWDMMKRPPVTRFAERLFNPLLGKSVVVYLKKCGEEASVT